MKNLLLSATLIITAIGFGQKIESHSLNVISTTVTQSIEVEPSHYTVILSLSEKVNIDEETQATNPVTMEMILTRLTEKMKPYELDENDLDLYSLSENTSATLINGYNAYNNYSASKKKLLSRSYQLKWTKGILELETFLRSLRFNGFESAFITPEYSDISLTEAKEELLVKALTVAKRNISVLAKATEVELGALQSILENYYAPETYPYANYNYNYNNNGYGNGLASISVSGMNVKSRKEMVTLTVSYSIKD